MTMDHQFLNQARRDLERAETARSRAEALLLDAEKDVARLRGFIDQYEFYVREFEKTQNTIRNRLTTRNLTDVAISIIEKSEEPISIQAILSKLHSLGIEVGGENKSANLAAYLSKDNRVRYERGLGWMISADALFPNASARPSNITQNSAFATDSASSFSLDARKRYREGHLSSHSPEVNHPHASLDQEEDIPL